LPTRNWTLPTLSFGIDASTLNSVTPWRRPCHGAGLGLGMSRADEHSPESTT